MKKTYRCRAIALLVCLLTLLACVSCKQTTPTDDYWSTWQDTDADSTSSDEPDDSTQTPEADDPSEIEGIYGETVNRASLWEVGGFYVKDGQPAPDEKSTRIRTKAFLDVHRLGVIRSEKLEFTLCAYSKESGDYVGFWNGSTFSTNNITYVDLFRDFDLCKDYHIKLLARMKDGRSVTPEDAVDIECLPFGWESDTWSAGVSFIEESGSMEAVRHWEQIADTCGVRVTFAVETEKVGTPGYVTWDEMTRLQSRGFSFIACPNIALSGETDVALLEADLAATVAAFAEHHIENRFLLCPAGIDADASAIVRKYFQAVVTDEDAVNAMPLNTYDLNAYSYTDPNATQVITVGEESHTVHAPRSADALQDLLDTAVGHGAWVILRTHFENDYENGNYCDAAMVQSVIDLCRHAAQNGMQLLHFDDGYDHFKNRLEIGSIESGDYYIVDHNGRVHEGTTKDDGEE